MPGLWFQTKPASPSQTIPQPSGRRRRFQSDYPMCRLSRSAASVALNTRSRVSAVGKVQEVAACNAPSGAIPSFHRLVFVFVGTKKNVSKFGPKIGSAPPHGSATCARKNVECDQIRVSVSVRACTPSCWCFHNTFRHLCAFLWGSLAMFSYSRSRQKCDHRGVYSTRLALTVRPSRVPRPPLKPVAGRRRDR